MDEYLECQTCGYRIRMLTPDEIRQVAANPHNYIVDCYQCKKEQLEDSLNGTHEECVS